MPTKEEIQAKYLALHDALGTRKDTEDKELFDQQHRQIWSDCDVDLKARKDELKVKPILSAEEEREQEELNTMFPDPSPPGRDYAKEIDELREKVKRLEDVADKKE